VTYFKNLWLWLRGFARFKELRFKDGWSSSSVKWWLLYLADHGCCVIFLAGPVTTISRYAQMHRMGWFWDKLLDSIEALFDPDHGQKSGPVLWGSEEPAKFARILVPVLWLSALVALLA